MAEQAKARSTSRSRAELEQRRRVLRVAKGLSVTLGADFFQSIVEHLGTAFRADCAYLAERLRGNPNRIRTLSVYRARGDAANFEQDLTGTAAGQTMRDGAFITGKDAAHHFPLDSWVSSMAAQTFAGIRLCDSLGQPIGLVALVAAERAEDPDLIRNVLETFAPRAAAELERKRTLDIRTENEERYHAFISTNQDAMGRLEFSEPIPVTLPEDEQIDRIFRLGHLAECNTAFAILGGASSPEDLVGKPTSDIVPRDPRIDEELRAMIRSGFRASTIETTPSGEDGRLQYRLRSQLGIVENGELRRIWLTIRDITNLRRVERSLAASERQFREVLEGIQLPAIMLDPNGKTLFANRFFLFLSQRTAEELSALTWLGGVISTSETAIWKAMLQQGGDGPRATAHFEGSIIPRQGQHLAIVWDTIGLRDSEGKLVGLAGIGRDVTNERALEMEIRQAQKLDSIGRLSAGIAHDFNNFLTVIAGNTEVLLTEIRENNPQHARLVSVRNAAMLCGKLTERLLAFGRKQRLNPELIILNDLLSNSADMIRSLAGDHVEIHLDLEPRLWRIYADPAQIHRTITNLVANARDAMPDGGLLTIATLNAVVEPKDPAHPGVRAGDYVRLIVADSGIGLSEEARDRLFEPFFTTKGAGHGTGLGLATVYGIVTQSGGYITVRSEPGNGASFEILLPAAAGNIDI
jgi:PAS domain S-box-containing protein